MAEWEVIRSQGKTVYHRRQLGRNCWLSVKQVDGGWVAALHLGMYKLASPVLMSWQLARQYVDSIVHVAQVFHTD